MGNRFEVYAFVKVEDVAMTTSARVAASVGKAGEERGECM